MTPAPATVTYYGISILQSRTFWINLGAFVFAVLSAEDVITLLPHSVTPFVPAVLAVINIWLRTVTVRPVIFAAPGTTLPIEVPRLGPPAPPLVTD
jgi:hypothetical protein